MAIYAGVNDIAQNVKKMYVGVGGVARLVKKAYVGVYGIARKFYELVTSKSLRPYTPQTTPTLSSARALFNQAASTPSYAIAFGGQISSSPYSSNAFDAFSSSIVRTTGTMYGRHRTGAACSFGSYAIVCGGYTGSGYSSQYEYYGDTLTYTTGTLSTSTNAQAMVSNSSHWIWAGGYGGSLRNTCNCFDTSFTRTVGTSLNGSRQLLMGACVNDNILVCGGANTSTTLYNTVDVYDKDLVHSIGTSLSTARCRGAGGHINNYALIMGGHTSMSTYANRTGSDVVDVYDKDLVHSTTTGLSHARGTGGEFSVQGLCGMLCGGEGGKVPYNYCDYYDDTLTRGSFTLGAEMQEMSATAIGDYVLTFGGLIVTTKDNIYDTVMMCEIV